MGYYVILKNGAKVTLNFWCSALEAAQNAVLNHLAGDKKRQAEIADFYTGDLRHYFWIGDKLNISLL